MDYNSGEICSVTNTRKRPKIAEMQEDSEDNNVEDGNEAGK